MTQNTQRILEPRKPIAIVRLDNLEEAVQIGRALAAGGITAIEFTLTNPRAPQAIQQVRKDLPGNVLVGAGTVLDAESARRSVQAGAQFLVTPALLPEVIGVGRSEGIPVICGAWTPTEILSAWRLGADLVKVFPAAVVGPAYIKEVLAPLPDVLLVPTGGINLDNCAAFLAAGAYTVAIGGRLVSADVVQRKDWPALTALAQKYVRACAGERP
jgi:2-dehydro-3-deoxyphosphogluconate aldolase/(4S)-4-hydroxy-2-oxoglutarate aldolase